MTVVDNASRDETPDVVARARPDAVVILNDTNRGFAAAANQGITAAPGTAFVLLLNPDATLATDAVERLVDFADEHPRAGLVSALVIDDGGRPERFAAGREPSVSAVAIHELGLHRLVPGRALYRVPDVSAPTSPDWVAGTVVLVRRAALDEVGLFDEQFFLYSEDVDLCRRMRAAGWEVWLEPAARAVHRRSTSVNAAGPWVDEHRMGSLDRYFAAHHGRAATFAFRASRVVGAGARAVLVGAAGSVLRRDGLRARAAQRRRDAARLARMMRHGGHG